VCLWEAGFLGEIEGLVERTVGTYGTNHYFEVDAPRTFGRPR
jgi:hypothetical protein